MNIYLEAISAAKLSAEASMDEKRLVEETGGATEMLAAAKALTFLRSFVSPELAEAAMSLEICGLKADVGHGGADGSHRFSLLIYGISKPLVFTSGWSKAPECATSISLIKISDGVNLERDCYLDAGEVRTAILTFVTNSMRELVSQGQIPSETS